MVHIKGFRLDNRKNNGTHHGYLYKRYIKIPFASGKYQTRVVRLWVPDDFDINKKYGVIYMTDGQNAVDENLSAFGEWDMEDHLYNLKEEGCPDFIIVGIDCPRNGNQRTLEYLPAPCSTFKDKRLKNYYGNRFAQYLVNKIVPFINSTFNIDENLVTFCGSSMGGLFSFYICSKYPEIFKYCISFSPAFFFFTPEKVRENFAKREFNRETDPTYIFFIGGGDDLEKRLLPNTDLMVELLDEQGFAPDKLLYLKDLSRIHHESTWSDFVEPAIRFIFER